MRCVEYREVSPENEKFAWCAKYLVNLDNRGRFCKRCRSDRSFQRMLLEVSRVRGLHDCSGTGGYCEIFQTVTTLKQCERCQSDGEYRAFIRSQAQVARRERIDNCPERGKVVRIEKQKCCGGKERDLEIFECRKLTLAHKGICTTCREPRRAVLTGNSACGIAAR